MALRVVVSLLIVGALVIGCKNQPYETPTLAVSSVSNADSGSVTYRYREGHIYKFQKNSKLGVVTTMRFVYTGRQLDSLVMDSITTSHKIDRFYGWGTSTVIDSTVLYTDSSTVLLSVRTVMLDESSNPATVDLKLFTDSVNTEQTAQLTWEDGNVVRLVTTNVNTSTTQDISIAYDGKTGTYVNTPDNLYTLSLQKLYWLSGGNPLAFTENGKTKKYIFTYNKFGYPNRYQNEVSVVFSVAYSSVAVDE